ncbi:hypothetical protein GCM10027290_17920 [Micromonospora sonneratiae]
MIVVTDDAGRQAGKNGPVLNAAMVDRLWEAAGPLLRRTGPLPRPTRRNLMFDRMLALVVGVTHVYYALNYADNLVHRAGPLAVDGPRLPPLPPPFLPPVEPYNMWDAAILTLVAAAPLAARRRYPLAVLWVVITATLLVPHPRLTFYACVVASYSAAAYSPYRVATLASLPAAALAVGVFQDSALPTVPSRYAPFLILIPIALAANGVRAWKHRVDEGRARLAVLEHRQVEALRRAVEQERARIARELHDVVTHNVSVMVIQAGAARKVMDTAPGQAREALLAVEAGGRAAMAELRHVMGLLTMEADDGRDPAYTADLAPQPGLDRLDALVTRVRDTGLPVELTVSGQPCPVPPGVELAAYRVVQEALTNTVKHAEGAVSAVTVEYGVDRLRVEVTDTGGRPGTSAATGNRRGLIGLRERLAVYGGTLHTGPRPSGGYRVEATIPLAGS